MSAAFLFPIIFAESLLHSPIYIWIVCVRKAIAIEWRLDNIPIKRQQYPS